MFRKGAALAVCLSTVVCCPGASAAATAAATSAPAQVAFASAPAQMRDFLVQAEAADKLDDPLARCLAFPGFPHNQWPAGMAHAQCELVYGPRITLARAGGLLAQGKLAELDALYAADLERHFSESDFSEVIHRDFDDFDASYEAGRFTKEWLEKAPASAYALAARAAYYEAMSWQARGGAWARDTPDENLGRMGEFADLSMGLYARALKVEPRLMPAYAGLINLGGQHSNDILQGVALKAANAIDPACMSVMRVTMVGLEPRWGGNYPAMQRYADSLAPYVSRRPLLALFMPWPTVDAGNTLWRNDKYAEAIALLKPVMLQTSASKPFKDVGWSMLETKADDWETLQVLLQAARFEDKDDPAYVVRSLGRLLLLRAQQPAWATRYLKRAIEIAPDDAYAHYLLAASYLNSGRYPQAEPEYRIAMAGTDKILHRDASHELVLTLLGGDQRAKARHEVEILNRDFPEYAQGWLDRATVLSRTGSNDGVLDALRQFVKVADRKDPAQRAQAESLERQLKDVAHAPAQSQK